MKKRSNNGGCDVHIVVRFNLCVVWKKKGGIGCCFVGLNDGLGA